MKTAQWLLSGFVVGLLTAAVSSCGVPAQSKCDAASCPTGCCTAAGQCQLILTANACGTQGNACQVCTGHQTCQAGACVSNLTSADGGSSPDAGTPLDGGTQLDAGTADAGTQNDAGTTSDAGTGSDGGCTHLTTFTAASTNAGYDLSYGVVYAELLSSTGNPTEVLAFEEYEPNLVPKSVTFDLSYDYASCMSCAMYGEQCNSNSCLRSYLARGGTASVTEATELEQGGSLKATLSNLVFHEWDFNADAPVPGGKCVTIDSAVINASW